MWRTEDVVCAYVSTENLKQLPLPTKHICNDGQVNIIITNMRW